jgi:hypothetical protein
LIVSKEYFKEMGVYNMCLLSEFGCQANLSNRVCVHGC